MFLAIWYHLYNLTLFHGCFSRFLNCRNSTKSRKTQLLRLQKMYFSSKNWYYQMIKMDAECINSYPLFSKHRFMAWFCSFYQSSANTLKLVIEKIPKPITSLLYVLLFEFLCFFYLRNSNLEIHLEIFIYQNAVWT